MDDLDALDNADQADDGRWRWAYLIPLMALLIPILAVTDAQLDDIVPVLVTLAIIGGLWASGRNLLGYRHELRMKELEVEREVAALEAERLKEAQKVLDLDDRIAELKKLDREPPTRA